MVTVLNILTMVLVLAVLSAIVWTVRYLIRKAREDRASRGPRLPGSGNFRP